MLLISTVTVLLHLSLTSAGDPCPPRLALAPCTCTYVPLQNRTLIVSADNTTRSPNLTTNVAVTTDSVSRPDEVESSITVVECRVSRSIAALEETISSALNRKLVDRLVVANVPARKEHTLARLPSSGWLTQVRVRQFEVLNSKLSGDFIWYGQPFAGQSMTLLKLSARKCSLTGAITHDGAGTVNTKGINTLHQLQELDFSDNFLTYVQSTAFRFPPANLSTVDLSRNSIQFIESTSFQYIAKLRFINLSHNLLESLVGRAIFESTPRYLEHIDLSWNHLETLPADIFVRMPALKMVDLSNNFLYSMPEKPWGAVWTQLEFIDVSGNFVACDCNLLWLLPILSPPDVNSTTTPVPSPLPGQTVLGYCSKSINGLFAVKYDLDTLTRDRLSC